MAKEYMFEKGAMRKVKKPLGIALLILGGGLILTPDKVVSLLSNYLNPVIGILSLSGGYFLAISGRRYD